MSQPTDQPSEQARKVAEARALQRKAEETHYLLTGEECAPPCEGCAVIVAALAASRETYLAAREELAHIEADLAQAVAISDEFAAEYRRERAARQEAERERDEARNDAMFNSLRSEDWQIKAEAAEADARKLREALATANRLAVIVRRAFDRDDRAAMQLFGLNVAAMLAYDVETEHRLLSPSRPEERPARTVQKPMEFGPVRTFARAPFGYKEAMGVCAAVGCGRPIVEHPPSGECPPAREEAASTGERKKPLGTCGLGAWAWRDRFYEPHVEAHAKTAHCRLWKPIPEPERADAERVGGELGVVGSVQSEGSVVRSGVLPHNAEIARGSDPRRHETVGTSYPDHPLAPAPPSPPQEPRLCIGDFREVEWCTVHDRPHDTCRGKQ